jgi:eukaryotic-like serine/threonine-protein kinase
MGMVIGGRYRLEDVINGGELGDVWRCVDEPLGRTVAAKLLRAPLRDAPQLAERVYLGWTRPMTKIDHHGVVRVHDSGVDPVAGAYVIMEYVEGESLRLVLDREGRFSPARTMDLVAQVADALGAVHEWGIVHRDLRPAKVLVRPDATVVLSTFGLEYATSQADLATVLIGRAGYAAPEGFMGHRATDRSDIYSLGVIAYQCLSGRRPFEADNPLEVALRSVRDAPPPLPPDVPAPVRSIVERAMAKDPNARWQTAAALAAAARAAGTNV